MKRGGVLAMLLLPLVAGCASSVPAPGARGLIVAFGDSYTEGHGASREEAYPTVLASALGRRVLNKGVTGETAGDALRRLDRDVLRNEPDLVIVEFGVNEAYRGEPVSASLANIETIVARIRSETNASIVLVGVHFWSFREDFDAGLGDIASRYSTGLVLDVLDGIVSSRYEADDGDATLRSDDFHPNAKGYAIMAERIRPSVEAQLRDATNLTRT